MSTEARVCSLFPFLSLPITTTCPLFDQARFHAQSYRVTDEDINGDISSAARKTFDRIENNAFMLRLLIFSLSDSAE